MSADSFHALVKNAMKAKKRVYDFMDFEQCVSKNGIAMEMSSDDFFDFKNHLGIGKDTNYPYLSDVRELQVRKGSTKMFCKTNPNDTNHECGEFATKEIRGMVSSFLEVSKKPGSRGVTTLKLEEIVKKIGPLIPKEQIKFLE